MPLPSPALSDGGGFAAFDPSPLPAAGFNFDRHFAQTFVADQFDDPEEQGPSVPVTTDELDLHPPNLRSDPLPASPSSLVASTSSQVDGFSDYSPSPSVGSVRMAQLVTRMPARRALEPEPSRLSVATSLSGAAETDEEEEGIVWDVRRLSKPARPIPVRKTTTELFAKAGKPAEVISRSPTCASATSEESTPPPAPATVVNSLSDDSVAAASSSETVARYNSSSEESDPSITPAEDAMGRMKNILGPKVKKISAAPWDTDSTSSSTDSPLPPTKPRVRSSMDALRGVASASSRPLKTSSKENDKPRSSSRSKSFSLLASRKLSPSEADIRASEEALKGLGLGKVESLTVFGAKIPSVPAAAASMSSPDFNDDSTRRRPSETPPLSEQLSFAFPSPSSKSPSPSKSSASAGSTSRVRPPPIHFDMVVSARSPSPTSVPHSAPPYLASFAAVPRSSSMASLGVHRPRPSASASSLATSASSSSPSTPTGQLTAVASSPTSPSGSYFGPGGALTSPSGPGHRLISLDEARERESQRIAAGVARRERAMTPVEHIAGKNEVLYGGVSSRDRTRESTADSSRTRATSGPATSSASTTPAYSPSPSSSALAQQAPVSKTLKPKKSGFLRRMMGADKPFAEVPARSESVTTSALATSPPYSVTISSPPAPVDLGRQNLSTDLATTSGSLAPSPSVGAISPSNHITFLPTPVANPEHRLRKGAAPSLSLRPISMAFSAGLPVDFLAVSDTRDGQSSSPSPDSPPYPPQFLTSPFHVPTSPVESLGFTSVQSPFAPSFDSSISGGQPSLFDQEEDLASSTTTPITPAFPSLGSPISPIVGSPSYAALQEELSRAKRLWYSQRWELETHVKILQAELEQVKAGQPTECLSCGAELQPLPALSPSIVERPRFKGHGGSGSLYSSSLVA